MMTRVELTPPRKSLKNGHDRAISACLITLNVSPFSALVLYYYRTPIAYYIRTAAVSTLGARAGGVSSQRGWPMVPETREHGLLKINDNDS
jgi:hypothetical protein